MPLWKRILLIAGFIIVVILLALLLYFVFFRQPQKVVTPPIQPPPPISGLPTAGEYEVTPRPPAIPSTPPAVILREELPKTAQEAQGGPVETVEIQQDSNRAAQLGGDGTSVVTFDEYTGTFYRITPDGVPTKMTDQTFTGAQKITWAPQTDKAFIEFPDGSNIVYNFEEKKQISIPSHWTEPSFSPDGTKISMKIIGEDPDNRWFAVADADGSNARVLEPLLKKPDSSSPPGLRPDRWRVSSARASTVIGRNSFFWVSTAKTLRRPWLQDAALSSRGRRRATSFYTACTQALADTCPSSGS